MRTAGNHRLGDIPKGQLVPVSSQKIAMRLILNNGFPLATSPVGGPSPVSLRLLVTLKCWAPDTLRQLPPSSGTTVNPHPGITVGCMAPREPAGRSKHWCPGRPPPTPSGKGAWLCLCHGDLLPLSEAAWAPGHCSEVLVSVAGPGVQARYSLRGQTVQPAMSWGRKTT